MVKERPPSLVAEAQVRRADFHRGFPHFGLLAIDALDIEIDDPPEFIYRRHGIVTGFQLFADLAHRDHDAPENEFTGNELAESDLLTDIEPATEDEKGGFGENGEREDRDDLPHEDAEVGRATFQLVNRELIRALMSHRVAPRFLEGKGKRRDLFEPVHHVELHPRLSDTAGHGPAPEQ